MQRSQLNFDQTSIEANPQKTTFKIQSIWWKQDQIHNKFKDNSIKQKCIILVGQTNVGKTTLLYYLSGLKLNLKKNQKTQTVEMQAQETYENAIICNNLSTTQIPNIFLSNPEGESELNLIDLPGMNENNLINLISNIFTFQLIFEKLASIRKIHIVFVISEQMLDAIQILQNLHQFVKHFGLQSFRKTHHISLIFTKTEEDQDQVKEKFYQNLETIKQEISDETQQKDVMALIQLLQELKQMENTFFIFPREQPVQQDGLGIVQNILRRDQFFQNNQQANILHQNFAENVLETTKIKFTQFQTSFNKLTTQSLIILQKAVYFALEFARLTHKNIAPQMFQSEKHFNQAVIAFCSANKDFLVGFSRQNITYVDIQSQSSNFQEIMLGISEKITNQSLLYALDKKIRLFFNFQKLQGYKQLEAEQDCHNLTRSVIVLGQIYKMIGQIVSQVDQGAVFRESIQNIGHFLQWVSGTWFDTLTKFEVLLKIKQNVKECEDQIQKFKAQQWSYLSQQTVFIDAINKFAQKSTEQQSQQQSDYQNQPAQEIQKSKSKTVPVTMALLKAKYLKIQEQQKIKRIIQKQRGQQVKNLELDDKIYKLVKYLEQSVFQSVKRFESKQKSYQVQGQQRVFLSLLIRNLKHKQFLKSALQNLCLYVKFILYTNTKTPEAVSQTIIKFIDTMCSILEEYSLYQESALLYLFANNLQGAEKSLSKGYSNYRVQEKYLIQILIPSLKSLARQRNSKQSLLVLQNLSIKCFNFLGTHYAQNRQHQNTYENMLVQILDQLYINEIKEFDQTLSKSEGYKMANTRKLKLNYFVLRNQWFCPQQICQKLDFIDQRNQKSNLQDVHTKFIEHRKSAMHSVEQSHH